MNIFEILKNTFLGIFADMYIGGAFNLIVRRSPKRVIKHLSNYSGKEEYYPQWKFLWWHYDWYYDGYEHIAPTFFESEDMAIYWAQHLCEKMDIMDNTETVWKSEK